MQSGLPLAVEEQQRVGVSKLGKLQQFLCNILDLGLWQAANLSRRWVRLLSQLYQTTVDLKFQGLFPELQFPAL